MSKNNRQRQWPDMPCKIKLFVSALSLGFDITRRSDGTVNRCLMSIFDRKASPSKTPINGVTTTDIAVDESRDLWFRLYNPTAATTAAGGDNNRNTALPVIFFFHGGGFAYMSANSKPYDDFCYRLARDLSSVIISVNYRLAPEQRCPTQYEDCLDAMKFIDSSTIEELSTIADLKQCFVAGDSAGGNLVHHVAVKASEYEFANIKLIGNIAIQPFFGGEERTESELRLTRAPFVTMERADWMWKAFLPEGSNRDHWAANVFGQNSADISGLTKFPATIIFVGGYDPLQDWQKRYYHGLLKYGKKAYLIEYPNAFHTFYAYPEVAESSLFFKEVKNFIHNQIVN